jgi:hypothetical protein
MPINVKFGRFGHPFFNPVNLTGPHVLKQAEQQLVNSAADAKW